MTDSRLNEPVETIKTVLCQQQGHTLLLPDVIIAEIIDHQPRFSSTEAPWYADDICWREQTITTIALDQLTTKDTSTSNQPVKIIVMHALTGELDYYGLITLSTPRLLRVEPSMLQDQVSNENEYIQASAVLNNERVIVPDLEKIEATIVRQQAVFKHA